MNIKNSKKNKKKKRFLISSTNNTQTTQKKIFKSLWNLTPFVSYIESSFIIQIKVIK